MVCIVRRVKRGPLERLQNPLPHLSEEETTCWILVTQTSHKLLLYFLYLPDPLKPWLIYKKCNTYVSYYVSVLEQKIEILQHLNI